MTSDIDTQIAILLVSKWKFNTQSLINWNQTVRMTRFCVHCGAFINLELNFVCGFRFNYREQLLGNFSRINAPSLTVMRLFEHKRHISRKSEITQKKVLWNGENKIHSWLEKRSMNWMWAAIRAIIKENFHLIPTKNLRLWPKACTFHKASLNSHSSAMASAQYFLYLCWFRRIHKWKAKNFM